MEKTKEFSKYVKELTIIWLEWLKNNEIAQDDGASYGVRRKSAEACETLIKRRHVLINLMNLQFER